MFSKFFWIQNDSRLNCHDFVLDFFFFKIEWNISSIFIAQNIFLYFSIVNICFRVLWINIEFHEIIRIYRIILFQILNSKIDWNCCHFEFISLHRCWTNNMKSSFLRKKWIFCKIVIMMQNSIETSCKSQQDVIQCKQQQHQYIVSCDR